MKLFISCFIFYENIYFTLCVSNNIETVFGFRLKTQKKTQVIFPIAPFLPM